MGIEPTNLLHAMHIDGHPTRNPEYVSVGGAYRTVLSNTHVGQGVNPLLCGIESETFASVISCRPPSDQLMLATSLATFSGVSATAKGTDRPIRFDPMLGSTRSWMRRNARGLGQTVFDCSRSGLGERGWWGQPATMCAIMCWFDVTSDQPCRFRLGGLISSTCPSTPPAARWRISSRTRTWPWPTRRQEPITSPTRGARHRWAPGRPSAGFRLSRQLRPGQSTACGPRTSVTLQPGPVFPQPYPVEQHHIVEAFVFELSKCEQAQVRARMAAGLRNVDDDLAAAVADGLGLPQLPERLSPAQEPIDNLAVTSPQHHIERPRKPLRPQTTRRTS